MIELKHPRQIRLIEPFVFFVVIGLLFVYLLGAFNSQDWIWFASSAVDAHPDRIVVWQSGEQTVIQPGHEDYEQLAEAAHLSLSDFSNTDMINIGFGEDSLAYYDDDGVMVEFFYNQPVDYHAAFRVGEPTKLLVPVNGRHAGYDYFFRGGDGEWWFGAMRMADSAPLFNALTELGYSSE